MDWIPEGTLAALIPFAAYLRATNFRLLKRLIIAIRGSKTSVVTAAMLEDTMNAVTAAEREADRWQRRHSSCESEVQYCEREIARLRRLLSANGLHDS